MHEDKGRLKWDFLCLDEEAENKTEKVTSVRPRIQMTKDD